MPTTPFGRLVRVSVNPPVGSIVRLTGPLTLCFGFDASVAWMVMFEVPAVVGVPLTVQPVSVRPAGRAPPVTVQVYGAVPPVTPIVLVYGTPTKPFGRLANVSVRFPGVVIVKLNGPLTLCCGVELSVTCSVRFEIPAAVGVPLIVQPFCVNPAGNVPTVVVQVNGAVPPVVRIVAKYG
jgi:hypothetical protein